MGGSVIGRSFPPLVFSSLDRPEHAVGPRIEKLWSSRYPADALERLGTRYRRLVVVLQPQVLRTRIQAVRQDPEHGDRGRLCQLDTLLHSAEASCRNLGAELIVLAHQR